MHISFSVFRAPFSGRQNEEENEGKRGNTSYGPFCGFALFGKSLRRAVRSLASARQVAARGELGRKERDCVDEERRLTSGKEQNSASPFSAWACEGALEWGRTGC